MAVTVTTGRTHARWMRLLVGGANLSGDARGIGSLGLEYDTAQVSGLSSGLHEYLKGLATSHFGPIEASFNNTAAAEGPIEPGIHTALNGMAYKICTAVIGIGEAPTIGAPAYSVINEHVQYIANTTTGGAVMLSGDFSASGAFAAKAGWGQMLAVGASISSTSSLGSLDNGASSANGAIAVLHLCTSAGAMGSNDWAIKIEHSANDSSWADLVTFSADGSAVTAEWDDTSATSTVNQYTRVTATKTAGTDIVIWVNLIRL